MGWEAAETVVHEHDGDGRLVSSRVTRDIEWDDWQRALTLALVDLERETGPHGHPMWEATNPTAVDPNGDYHYAADEPVVDFAAQVQARAEKAWRDDPAHKDEDTSGLFFPVRKVYARD